jgi:hypothetical protein
MKITFAFPLAVAFLAGNLFASDDLAKQRAKELVNQNNVRQGIAAPVPPPPPPSTAAPAAPTQSPALARLKADLAAIKTGDAVTPQQKQRLATDLTAVAAGAAKPSAATASQWAEDVSAGFVQKSLSSASLTRFVQEIDAVLNPAKYPLAKMDAIFTDVQAIFQDNGLLRGKAAKIADDMRALGGEVKAR